jgi:crotonobetainyl-CoA:carnitine CoA-transferase CaiB-like acyl-CoA transferase
MLPLSGTRALDCTQGIAGGYATKVLRDAGADVVKVEPGDGDPLRGWRSGALFEYLNGGKRSVSSGEGLVDRADIVFGDERLDVAALRAAHPSLVVVTITPFGMDGPWAGRPATEFTLQASCGSTGSRGLPEQAPLSAGGRIGEWLAGTYAALASIAALREARRSGVGEHVDVAMLDAMTVTMTTYPSLFASLSGWPPLRGTGRAVEVPSVEPTSDGYVVFTTNSAQQYQDFMVMIGRADLLEDASLARAQGRFERRAEFLEAVHAYTTKRTTVEVLEDAALMRIPSGPVLNGRTVTAFEQFVANSVFTPAASGRFVQPRRPYRIDGVGGPVPGPVPAPAASTGTVEWPARPAREPSPWRLPLAGVRVIDLTAWWAGPVGPQALSCLGADVIKVESITRPDLMRYASPKPPTVDRWYEWGPVFHGANTGKRAITLDLTRPEGIEVLERLVATADVLVENYTPRVMGQFGLGWERLHALNPRLVMVRMPAFGLDGPWRDRTGFAQTMECVTGMAWLTGFPGGPPVLVRGACDPLAGMHAMIATLVALEQRELDGEGHLVEAIMVEAALNVAAEQAGEYTASEVLLERDGNRGPVAAPQGVYPCRGDDRWVAIAVASDDQWAALVDVLGRPAWAAAADLATEGGRRGAHDRLDDDLARWAAGQDADQLAERLVAAGVAAAAVVVPRDMVHNPQLRHRRFFEVEDHPVAGRHEVPSFPVRFAHVDAWYRRHAPTLGEHNDEVLTELGLAEQIPRLRELGIIGERVVNG